MTTFWRDWDCAGGDRATPVREPSDVYGSYFLMKSSSGVIIVDLHVPGGTGIDIIDAAKRFQSATTVVVVKRSPSLSIEPSIKRSARTCSSTSPSSSTVSPGIGWKSNLARCCTGKIFATQVGPIRRAHLRTPREPLFPPIQAPKNSRGVFPTS